MMNPNTSTITVFLLCLVSGWVAAANSVYNQPEGVIVKREVYKGVSRLKLLPQLWTDKIVNISCPGAKSLSVYAAATDDEVKEMIRLRQVQWCGWEYFIGNTPDHCILHISPFIDTVVAVTQPKPTGILVQKSISCEFEIVEQLSLGKIVRGVAGALLFLYAGALSTSTPFRLGTGSLGFTALSGAIILVLVFRLMPGKKSFGAAALLLGSTWFTILRSLFGRIIPTWRQMWYSYAAWLYIAVSGLAGLTLSYYFDNPENVKLNTILRHALHLVGLGLLLSSTTMPEASIAMCSALLLLKLLSYVPWPKRKPPPPVSSPVPPKKPLLTAVDALRQEEYGSPSDASGQSYRYVNQHPSAAGGPASVGSLVPPRQQFQGQPEEQSTPVVERNSRLSTALGTPLPGENVLRTPFIGSPGKSEWVMNESTGRPIKLNGPTFTDRVQEGYIFDADNMTLTPPPGGSHSTPSKARRRYN